MMNKEQQINIANAVIYGGVSAAKAGADNGVPARTAQDFIARNTFKDTFWVDWDKGCHRGMVTINSEDGSLFGGWSGDSLVNAYDAWKQQSETSDISTESADVFKIQTSVPTKTHTTHFVIPDTQVRPDLDLNYLRWVGEYIVNRKPDVIVHLGDHFDLPSLSSYDKGTRKAEGRRLNEDIEAGIEGLRALLKPLFDYQQKELAECGEILYKPRLVVTLGNHEQRLERHINANPELHGFVSYNNFKYKEFGFEVHDFLKPVIIDGVTYCHYMANPFSGKPYGGMAMNILKNVGESFTVGHKQTLDIATRNLPASGNQQWGIVAGAAYIHDEGYKGHQGNHHWRGVIVKHDVHEGSYNPMFVDMNYLEQRYE